MNESFFGAQLNGTELGGVVGSIAPFGIVGLIFWIANNVVSGAKGVAKNATSN